MISIQLPDGSRREFPGPVTVGRGRRLDRRRPGQGRARRPRRRGRGEPASSTPASRIDHDEQPRHRHRQGRRRASTLIRHSTAHLLAYAVKELFPDAQVTIGPVIENGFFYDFSYKRPFTPEDLVAIEAKMTELAKKDEKVERRVLPRDEAVAHFNAHRRGLQGRDHRRHPGGRGRLAVPRRRVRGPVPRPARAEHGQAQALQADEGGRRVLARRPSQRDAAADLRHGLGDQGRAAAIPAHARGGRKARPPQARPRARPVPHRRGRARRRLLASEGLGDLAGGGAVHARRLPRHRLPGSEGPADPRQEPLGEDRPLAELPREHVHHGVGEARIRAEADELPGPRADLQVAAAQLSRAADPLWRVRPVPPQRAERRDARDHAGARLHAGRRPHLLHRRPDPRGMRRLHGAAAEGLRRLRLHRHHLQGRDAAREPGRLRRVLGQGRVRPDGGACAARAASS